MKVYGYFRNMKDANEAVSKLKSQGMESAYMDINDHYVNHIDPGTNLAGGEEGYSLSSLVLGSGEDVIEDRSKTPLMAASPMASGMGGFEEIADVNCKVIVETSENDAKSAEDIIKSMGGELRRPNIYAPKSLQDIKLQDIKLKYDRLEDTKLEDL